MSSPGKLTIIDRDRIVRLRRDGVSTRELAREYSVTPQTIRRALVIRYVCRHCKASYMTQAELWQHATIGDP